MIRTLVRTLAVAVVLLPVAAALAQQPTGQPQMTPEQMAQMEAYMKAAMPGEQHKAMAGAAGAYDMEIKGWSEPGKPPMVDKGTCSRTMMLDGRVMVEDVTATMMGAPFKGQGMMGFDNVTGKYWSTWTDSMSTGLMVSEGTCDAKQSCTFIGTMNDPISKAAVKMKMNSKWVDPATEVFEMYGPGPDGKEMKMMEITYRKKK